MFTLSRASFLCTPESRCAGSRTTNYLTAEDAEDAEERRAPLPHRAGDFLENGRSGCLERLTERPSEKISGSLRAELSTPGRSLCVPCVLRVPCVKQL
jgi:hypothetical protein